MSDANTPGQGGKRAMPIGRPFVKGDPRANLGGPVSAKLRKLQKQLLTLAPQAFELMKQELAAGNLDALKLWMKHVVPVPKAAEEVKVEDPYKKMSDAELWDLVKKAADEREVMQ